MNVNGSEENERRTRNRTAWEMLKCPSCREGGKGWVTRVRLTSLLLGRLLLLLLLLLGGGLVVGEGGLELLELLGELLEERHGSFLRFG